MNDKGSTTTEDDLRSALAPDGTIAPLDPARVIAGARRRRKVRGLATAAIAVVAVGGVATGGILAGGHCSARLRSPPDPGPTTLASPRPDINAADHRRRSPSGPAISPATASPVRRSRRRPAVAALNGEPGPGAAATGRSLLSDESGTHDRHRGQPLLDGVRQHVRAAGVGATARAAAEAERTGHGRLRGRGQRDHPRGRSSASSTGPAGCCPTVWQTIRYTFPDGATEDAQVDGGFWLMRHVSEQMPSGRSVGDQDPGPAAVRVRRGRERLPAGLG